MLFGIVTLVSLGFCVHSSVAQSLQTCSNAGYGPCVKTGSLALCPTGYTCIASTSNCCANSDLIAAPTVAPATTTTASAPAAASCVDKINPSTGVSDCPQDAYLCNDATYKSLMAQQCPRTCGLCSGSSSSGTGSSGTGSGGSTSTSCVDKINPSTGTSDCPGDAYLCSNAMYQQLMQQQCPKTCGFC